MEPAVKAPAGTLFNLDWFHTYKWKVAGDVFVPVRDTDEQQARFASLVESDDVLWFSFKGLTEGIAYNKIVGAVRVQRVEPYPLNNTIEIWYNGEECAEGEAETPWYGEGLILLDIVTSNGLMQQTGLLFIDD